MKHHYLLALLPLALAGCSDRAPDVPQIDETGTPAPVEMGAADQDTTPAPTANPVVEEKALDLPPRFSALGTEPFWGAAVDGNSLTYTTPEFPAGTTVAVTRKAAGGTVTFAGTIDGKPLALAISAGPCSDGMSDKIHKYNAVRTIGPDIQRGCAGA